MVKGWARDGARFGPPIIMGNVKLDNILQVTLIDLTLSIHFSSAAQYSAFFSACVFGILHSVSFSIFTTLKSFTEKLIEAKHG